MRRLYQSVREPVSSILIEPGNSTAKLRYKELFYALILVLPALLPFLLISQYNHPSADDFCYSHRSRDFGFWTFQEYLYTTWTGRYGATALLSLSTIDPDSLLFYRLMPILLFVSFGASIYLFLKKLLPAAAATDRLVLSLLIFFLYIVRLPNIAEAFYWISGSLTYQLASTLCLLLFALILHLHEQHKQHKRVFYTILGSIICIVIVGLNETSMLLLCCTLFLWLAIRSYRQRGLDKPLLVLLLVTIAASLVVILAPGNAVRMSAKPQRFDVFLSVYGPIRYSITYIVHWLPFSVPLLLLFSGLLVRIAGNIRQYYRLPVVSRKHLYLLAATVLGFIALGFLPSFWGQGGAPPARTVNLIYVVYIFGGLALVLAFLVYLQTKHISIPRLSSVQRLMLAVLLLGMLVFWGNRVSTAYQDLAKGTARAYSQEMQQRYSHIRSCTAEGCIVPSLEHKPKTIYAYDLAPAPTEKTYYYNQCLSHFFHKKDIGILSEQTEMDLKEIHAQTQASGSGSRHPWELARLEVVYGLSEKYLANTRSAEVRVLDIGCGDLFFSSTLAQKLNGGRIIAVDTALKPEALPGINSRYSGSNIQVFQNLEEASRTFREAGLVFLLDVLEHIHDDAAFLEDLRLFPFITENTVLVITTPAYQSLFSSHDTFLDHYRRYSSSSLSAVLQKSGFSIVDKGYFFFSLLPIRFMQSMWEKLYPRAAQRGGTDAADWRGGRLSTRLFQNLLLLDYKLTSLLGRTGIKIGGLSTYAICKRSVS
ncbi:DUF6056 family protein [Cesiribacter sp. SM1]|uniref:DUF6056 family protein n=1 Tax=Cesiribacter sp. SM1 TaxID=2861196 RepID=UPI001CD7E88B|nr:DUF6056 family protein [Cesiribacter sp. SM1]